VHLSHMLMLVINCIFLGYCIGAIPCGAWICRAQGIDIFKAGSGNPGATNVKRVLGSKWGNCVFSLDCLKGFAAVMLPTLFISNAHSLTIAQTVCLTSALVGHCFSMFTQFKGGKGVATLIGGLLGLMPLVCILGLMVWTVIFYTTRYVSLASMCFGVTLPIGCKLLYRSPFLLDFCLIVSIAILVLHHKNIKRLLSGTENRFNKKL
jgi:glycerol-3-phosphate acyltransferase PlsY